MRCHNPPLGRNWTVLCLLLSVLQQIWTSCCYSNSAGCPCFPREHVCESSKLVVVTWQRLQSRQGLRERPLRLKPLPLSQWHKLGQKIPPQTRSGHAKLTRSLASRTLSHRGIVLALLNGFDEITTKKYIHCCFRGILLKVHAHAGLERGTLRLDLCHNPTRWAFLGLFGSIRASPNLGPGHPRFASSHVFGALHAEKLWVHWLTCLTVCFTALFCLHPEQCGLFHFVPVHIFSNRGFVSRVYGTLVLAQCMNTFIEFELSTTSFDRAEMPSIPTCHVCSAVANPTV